MVEGLYNYRYLTRLDNLVYGASKVLFLTHNQNIDIHWKVLQWYKVGAITQSFRGVNFGDKWR